MCAQKRHAVNQNMCIQMRGGGGRTELSIRVLLVIVGVEEDRESTAYALKRAMSCARRRGRCHYLQLQRMLLLEAWSWLTN